MNDGVKMFATETVFCQADVADVAYRADVAVRGVAFKETAAMCKSDVLNSASRNAGPGTQPHAMWRWTRSGACIYSSSISMIRSRSSDE